MVADYASTQASLRKGQKDASQRTSLLLVDSVSQPGTWSRTRAHAEEWGIPVMSYAEYVATYFCRR
jgi:hypothetical protein